MKCGHCGGEIVGRVLEWWCGGCGHNVCLECFRREPPGGTCPCPSGTSITSASDAPQGPPSERAPTGREHHGAQPSPGDAAAGERLVSAEDYSTQLLGHFDPPSGGPADPSPVGASLGALTGCGTRARLLRTHLARAWREMRDAHRVLEAELERAHDQLRDERDAALDRVAELERELDDLRSLEDPCACPCGPCDQTPNECLRRRVGELEAAHRAWSLASARDATRIRLLEGARVALVHDLERARTERDERGAALDRIARMNAPSSSADDPVRVARRVLGRPVW